MAKRQNAVMIIALIVVLLSGCSLPAAPASSPDVAAIYTQAMETISVTLTQGALQAAFEVQAATPEPKAAVAEDTEVPTLPPTPAPTLPPTATPVPPTATPLPPTLAPTATPEPIWPILHVTEDTNCRFGPSPIYNIEGYLTPDMRVNVVGVNTSNTWWWVENPTYPGYHCWVWMVSSVVEGDTSVVPTYLDPWTPTPGLPVIDVDIVNWTPSQTVKCPVKLSFAGAIRTNRMGEISYRWLKNGNLIVSTGKVTIAADSMAYIAGSFNVSSSESGSMVLEITSPVTLQSSSVQYKVKCTE
jgi:hypothetical protein